MGKGCVLESTGCWTVEDSRPGWRERAPSKMGQVGRARVGESVVSRRGRF